MQVVPGYLVVPASTVSKFNTFLLSLFWVENWKSGATQKIFFNNFAKLGDTTFHCMLRMEASMMMLSMMLLMVKDWEDGGCRNGHYLL